MPAPTDTRPVLVAGRLTGAALILAMAAIHLYLWFDGYADIAFVGPSFLVNAVAGVAVATALLLVPVRVLAPVALLGAVLVAGTLAALLLSLTVGLFGFFDVLQAPLVPATLVVEPIGVLILAGTAWLVRGRR